MKKLLLALTLMVSTMLTGCVQFGHATLPPKSEFFVTSGDYFGKDYSPIALLESRQTLCTPCGLTLEDSYEKIQVSLKEELVVRAKAAGANAIINLQYNTFSLQFFSVVSLKGMAVKI